MLGVSPSASDDEIKKAYRDLTRKYHPDANVDNPLADLAEEKFKEVQEAYDTIMKERASGNSGGYSYGGGSNSSYGGSSSYGYGNTGSGYGNYQSAQQDPRLQALLITSTAEGIGKRLIHWIRCRSVPLSGISERLCQCRTWQ